MVDWKNNPITEPSPDFLAIAKALNSKDLVLTYNLAIKLYEAAKKFGVKIILHNPHNEWSWHVHLCGNIGKLNKLHIQITKKAWDYLMKLLS